jgi:hypothetical protein
MNQSMRRSPYNNYESNVNDYHEFDANELNNSVVINNNLSNYLIN